LSFWLSCHVIFDVGLPPCTIWRWPATGSYKSRNITSILSMSTILAVARILGVGISPDAWHSPSNSAQDWCCSVERRSSIPNPMPLMPMPRVPRHQVYNCAIIRAPSRSTSLLFSRTQPTPLLKGRSISCRKPASHSRARGLTTARTMAPQLDSYFKM